MSEKYPVTQRILEDNLSLSSKLIGLLGGIFCFIGVVYLATFRMFGLFPLCVGLLFIAFFFLLKKKKA